MRQPAYSTRWKARFASERSAASRAVHSVAGASSDLEGYDADHLSGITLIDVDLDATAVTAKYANITLTRTDLAPSGTGVTVTTTGGNPGPTPVHCAFPPFPEG